MNIKELIEVFKLHGRDVEFTTVVKNGVEKEGVIFKDAGVLTPVIFLDTIEYEMKNNSNNLSEAVAKIIKKFDDNKKPLFDPTIFYTREFIEKNVRIGIQKTSSEEVLKRDTEFTGIESYLYVKDAKEGDYTASIKLTKEALRITKIVENDLWEIAASNNAEKNILVSSEKLLPDMFPWVQIDEKFHLLSNDDSYFGAAAILDKKILRKYSKIVGTNKFYILPYSLELVLLYPFSSDVHASDLEDILDKTNRNEIHPEYQLSDRCYVYTIE